MYVRGEDMVYAANMVDMYFGMSDSATRAVDSAGNCEMEITKWGDIVLYRKNNKGVSLDKRYFNMII